MAAQQQRWIEGGAHAGRYFLRLFVWEQALAWIDHLVVNTHTVCYLIIGSSTASLMLRTSTGLPTGSGGTRWQRRVATLVTMWRASAYKRSFLLPSVRGQLAFFFVHHHGRGRRRSSTTSSIGRLHTSFVRRLPARTTLSASSRLRCRSLRSLLRATHLSSLRIKTWLMHLIKMRWLLLRRSNGRHLDAGQLGLLESQNLQGSHLVRRLLFGKQQRAVLIALLLDSVPMARLLARGVLIRF